jgi:MYXO-CTERM domain-containing protein
MSPRRLLVVLAITLSLWAPRGAAAFCQSPGPYLGIGPQLPLGCPVHVYWSPIGIGPGGPMQPPRVTTLRNGTYVDASGFVNVASAALTVHETFVDCELRVQRMTTDLQPFEHLTIGVTGVAVGDQIGIGTGWLGGIEIVPAGPCTEPTLPKIECTTSPPCFEPPPFESFESNGCSAGAGAAPGAGLLIALALLGRRRRPPKGL